jgi:hypothetical protein
MSGLTFGLLLIAGGFAVYGLKSALSSRRWLGSALKNQRKAA